MTRGSGDGGAGPADLGEGGRLGGAREDPGEGYFSSR
jgi:hypothetical protein